MTRIANPLTIPRGDYRYLRYRRNVTCLAGDSIEDWVCRRGDPVNGVWVVEKVDIYDRTKMPAVGVLISKATSTTGVIQIEGECDIFSGLDTTKQVAWLGTSGIQYTLPTPGPSDYAIA